MAVTKYLNTTSNSVDKFFFVTLSQTRAIWEERTSIEKIPSSNWPVGKPMGIFMNDNWCGRAQAAVGSAMPAQVVLRFIRKQTEQLICSKQ